MIINKVSTAIFHSLADPKIIYFCRFLLELVRKESEKLIVGRIGDPDWHFEKVYICFSKNVFLQANQWCTLIYAVYWLMPMHVLCLFLTAMNYVVCVYSTSRRGILWFIIIFFNTSQITISIQNFSQITISKYHIMLKMNHCFEV